ncbi:uncharacterized protein LOC120477621 [Pimephales promelas]|uniref:uncharacterized protein LOC120477621 n=1 Tax=Pimephales promelas TaxID=90988 RepID=UPI0019554DDB|nr:uncharacterized protein LOC120477621 [Pimephales promelas]
MEDELQELRELVAQLRADNAKLRQDQALAGPSDLGHGSNVPSPSIAPLQAIDVGTIPTERYVFIPRDRRCPKFNGRSGIGINEWVEEAQACMRSRHFSTADKAFFLFDHLEGEARDEIKYRPVGEREDPEKIITALKEVYGCSKSYVALQEAFFSRRQHDGETLLEFSLALMSLLEQVKQQSPTVMSNTETLLRDQFVEHVADSALRRELKQLVRRQPSATLLEVRREAIRWEQEGMLGGARGRSHSLPSAHGFQYGVQGVRPGGCDSPQRSEMGELREMLKLQQQQLTQLTQNLARLQDPFQRSRSQTRPFRNSSVICRRCQKPGHFARECDGERVPCRAPASRRDDPGASEGELHHSGPLPSEN